MIYSTGDGSVGLLQLDERAQDGVFYILRNRWHPPGDTTVDALLERASSRSTRSRSLTIYKMRRTN